jgi:hypothetical protein
VLRWDDNRRNYVAGVSLPAVLEHVAPSNKLAIISPLDKLSTEERKLLFLKVITDLFKAFQFKALNEL